MLIKQRREAADMFRKGGREELATKEESELAMIETYLPAAPSEEESDRAVSEAIAESGATLCERYGQGDEGCTGKARRKARRRQGIKRAREVAIIVILPRNMRLTG